MLGQSFSSAQVRYANDEHAPVAVDELLAVASEEAEGAPDEAAGDEPALVPRVARDAPGTGERRRLLLALNRVQIRGPGGVLRF